MFTQLKMTKKFAVAVFAACAAVAPAFLSAQEVAVGTLPNPAALPTIDELYLQTESSISIRALRGQLLTNNRTHQLLALKTIESQLQNGWTERESPMLFEAVSFALQEGAYNLAFQGNGYRVLHDYHPEVRYRAARIMGMIGTPEARTQLVQTITIDPDASVRARALYSLADIAQDPDGSVTFAIAKMLRSEHLTRHNQNTILAALEAINSINRERGNVVHDLALDVILDVAVGNPHTRAVRGRAMEVLSAM